MNQNNTGQISVHQLYFFIIKTQIGVGVLSLPFAVFSVAGTDGWISILLASILVQVWMFIMWGIAVLFPDKSLFDLTKNLLGRIIGTVLNIGYIVYFASVGTLILVLYVDIIKMWIFPLTPKFVILSLFILTCSYLILGGLESIVRFHVLASFLIVLLVILVAIGHKNAQYLYLLPIGNEGITKILAGTKESMFSMLGFEMFLLFHAHTKGTKKQKIKLLTLANITVTILYVFITISCFVYFSPEEIKLVPQPVLYMMKEYSLIILERIDFLFICMWIVIVATTFISFFYATTIGVTKLFRLRTNHKSLLLIAVVLLILSLIPNNKLEIQKWAEWIGNASYVFVFLIPMLLLFLAYIKRAVSGGKEG